MQKFRTCFFIATCLCLVQQSAFAEDGVVSTTTVAEQAASSHAELNDSSSMAKDILSEIIIRPAAVLGSATGLALFVTASPFSGLVSMAEPHDTFMTTWEDFVVTPYHFAFRRPLGDFSAELELVQ